MAAPPVSTSRLDGKVALVTGAGRGIGKGIALELAARGASVAINYRSSSEAAAKVVEEIEALGVKAVALQADVTKYEDIIKLFEEAKKHFGRIDIVMSNSGKENFTPLLEVTPEIYDDVFNTNTRAQFFVAQQAYKYLEMHGRVILLSSIAAGTRRPPNHSLYAGSKNAIKAFVRCLSTDMGDKRITVNAIAPGGVKSDMFAHAAWRYMPGGHSGMNVKDMENALAGITPLGRVADPTDIARVVCFLASEDGGWVNGKWIAA
jgi:3-oxoacyl-[acyl-carrier protein] reductase